MEVPSLKLVLDRIIVRRLSWSLTASGIFEPGIHLISGDIGSGKSTLSLLMAGLNPPEQGSVIHEGIGSILVSFQFPEFHVTGRSVAEECISWGFEPETILRQAGVGVVPEVPVLSLSRGELKRLLLTCILSRNCDLLLLDEPFSSLDCPAKMDICRQISRRTSGITVIFSHEQSIFPAIDHLWEINDGTLADCGRMPQGLLHWQHVPPLVRRLIETGRIPESLTPEGLQEAACRIRD